MVAGENRDKANKAEELRPAWPKSSDINQRQNYDRFYDLPLQYPGASEEEVNFRPQDPPLAQPNAEPTQPEAGHPAEGAPEEGKPKGNAFKENLLKEKHEVSSALQHRNDFMDRIVKNQQEVGDSIMQARQSVVDGWRKDLAGVTKTAAKAQHAAIKDVAGVAEARTGWEDSEIAKREAEEAALQGRWVGERLGVDEAARRTFHFRRQQEQTAAAKYMGAIDEYRRQQAAQEAAYLDNAAKTNRLVKDAIVKRNEMATELVNQRFKDTTRRYKDSIAGVQNANNRLMAAVSENQQKWYAGDSAMNAKVAANADAGQWSIHSSDR